jgi:hypothetical protein
MTVRHLTIHVDFPQQARHAARRQAFSIATGLKSEFVHAA